MVKKSSTIRLPDKSELERARRALQSMFGEIPVTDAQIVSTGLVTLVARIEQRMIPESEVAERIKPLVEAATKAALPLLAQSLAGPVIVGSIQTFFEAEYPDEHVRVDYAPDSGMIRVQVGDRKPITFIPAVGEEKTGEVKLQ